MEELRSFVVSFIIAVVLSIRWITRRRDRKREHRLDRYIRSLLAIEMRQLGLDSDGEAGDISELQALLDEVTLLRQEALQELSAHELREDRAADTFVGMCHALSNKLNAKITRQVFARHFGTASKAVQKSSA